MRIIVMNKTKHSSLGVDVTEAVQVIYDALMGSLDAGSGFLDAEEEQALHKLADAAGFTPPEFPHEVCKNCHHERGSHYSSSGCMIPTGQVVVETRTVREQVERKMTTDERDRYRQRLRTETSPANIIAALNETLEWREREEPVRKEVFCDCEKFA